VRALASIAWLVLGLVCAPLAAQTAAVPTLSARVTDTTATLDAAAIARIEAPLAALESRKGAQVAVLVIPSTAPETIEAYAVRAFEQWKLGRAGVDDGVLLVVAKDDRTVRIEVGYGLEGAIPDVAAYRVIQEYLVPRFREGDFSGGIEAATGALSLLIDGEALPEPMAIDPGVAYDSDRAGGDPGYVSSFDDRLLSYLPFAAVAFIVFRALLDAWVKSVWRRGLVGGAVLAVVAGGFSIAGLFPSLAWSLGIGFVAGFLFSVVKMGGGGGGGGYARSGSYSGSSSRSSSSGSSRSWSGGGGRSGGGGASGRW
jgi:uncharacterized protein